MAQKVWVTLWKITALISCEEDLFLVTNLLLPFSSFFVRLGIDKGQQQL
jgi:hypothetical protein